jgi:hypothetical protein
MPDLGQWIVRPHAYLVAHYEVVGWAIALEVGLAFALAIVAAEVATRRHRAAKIFPQDTLWHLFHRVVPGRVPTVSVKTTSNAVFQGPLITDDSSGDRSDRHFVIGPRLKRASFGIGPVDARAGWDRVVVALDSVDYMYVTFADPAQEPPSTASRWRLWWLSRPGASNR